MASRAPRLLAVWTAGVLLAGALAASSRAASGDGRVHVAAGAGDLPTATTRSRAITTSTSADVTTSTSEVTTTTAAPASTAPAPMAPAPSRPQSRTTTTTAASGGQAAPGEVPLPPGPWSPIDHMPAGYVPRINDGYITVQPPSPQTDDRITPVAGRPYVLQGRVTDERGNLLSGICVDVDHPGFGRVVTGSDGAFRFTGPGFEGVTDMPGIAWHIWDCTPGGSPDWAGVNTFLSRMTPGDTSTWFWRLGPASRFEARVVSEQTGLPVAGVCIHVDKGTGPYHAPARSGPTDTSGRVTLHGIGGWDQYAQAVPCSGEAVGWQGVQTYLPFRPGHTVVADLLIVG